MVEILSQKEINRLLNAINTGETDSGGSTETAGQEKVKIYDFRRPDKFTRNQINNLQMIHEGFADSVTTELSFKLRSFVDVYVASVDLLTYEEFIYSVANPTVFAVMDTDIQKRAAILEMDPNLAFTITDILFGGTGEISDHMHGLTDIELSVMKGVLSGILESLKKVWSSKLGLYLNFGSIETNPQTAQIVRPKDSVILITFDMTTGEEIGMLNLCIPYTVLEPVQYRLSAKAGYYSSKEKPNTEKINELEWMKKNIMFRHNIRFPIQGELSYNELVNLKTGSMVPILKNRAGSSFFELIR